MGWLRHAFDQRRLSKLARFEAAAARPSVERAEGELMEARRSFAQALLNTPGAPPPCPRCGVPMRFHHYPAKTVRRGRRSQRLPPLDRWECHEGGHFEKLSYLAPPKLELAGR